MNTRTISAIIIGLCLLSIIVGIINTAVAPDKTAKQEKVRESGGFQNIFTGGNKIALVTLEGTITSESSDNFLGDFNSANSVRKSLAKILEDNTVKGVLVRVDSPGGTVAISQEIYKLILRIREKKPVVVSMGDLAASGGYYISCAADRIYADPGTLTGSIGVIMNSINAQELLNEKLGIKANVIKSGKFKDIASPYRPLTSDERTLLQNLINNTYNQFVNAIIAGRVQRKDNYNIEKSALTIATLKKYADGRVFTGEQAQKLGFVDQLGGLYEAQQDIKKMAQKKFGLPSADLPVVQYNKPAGFEELFSGFSESVMPIKQELSKTVPLSTKYPHQPLFVWE